MAPSSSPTTTKHKRRGDRIHLNDCRGCSYARSDLGWAGRLAQGGRWWYLRSTLETGYDPLAHLCCARSALPLTLLATLALALPLPALTRTFLKLASKSKPSRFAGMPQPADTVRDLTVGTKGKRSTFVLTATSLYVHREIDSECSSLVQSVC